MAIADRISAGLTGRPSGERTTSQIIALAVP
jgi:hypothetical protein